MFGLSFGHIILFGVILLIFVGPEQLPEVARTIARVLNELKRATADFQGQFTNHLDLQKPWEAKPPPPPPPSLPEPAMTAAPQPQDLPMAHPMTPQDMSPAGHGYPDAPPGEQPLPTGAAPVNGKDQKS